MATASPTPVVKRRYYTPREAAALCRISLSQVYAKIDSGEILGVPVFGVLRVPCEWLDAYLDELERNRIAATAIDE